MTAPKTDRPPLLLFGLLAGLFVFAAYHNQWSAMEKLSEAVGPLVRFGTVGDFLAVLGRYGGRIFDTADAFWGHLLWVIPGIVLLLELRSKALSRTVAVLPRSDRALLGYLLLVGLVFLRSYLAKGEDMFHGDSPYYFYLLQNMTWNLRRLNPAPFFTFLHGGGAPVNQFYGPLFSVVAAAFNLVLDNPSWAAKLTLLLFHLSSVVGSYLFLRELTGSRRAGFFAGLAAATLYLRLHLAIYPGRYGDASIWAAYPFVYVFTERLVKAVRFPDIFGLAAAVSLCVFGSIGHSYYFLLLWGAYATLRLLLLPEPLARRGRVFLAVVAGGLLGFLFASYYLYSFLVEARWSVADAYFRSDKLGGREPGIFAPLLLWNSYNLSLFRLDQPWQSAYLGLSLVLLAAVGFVLILLRRERTTMPLALIATLALFLIGFYGAPFLKLVPFLHTYTQSRLLNLVAAVTIFLAGLGGLRLSERGIPPLLILGAVFLDLFPATFHDTASAVYGADARPLLRSLAQQHGIRRDNRLAPWRVDLLGRNHREIQNNWRAYDTFMAMTGIPIPAEQVWDYAPLRDFKEKVDVRILSETPPAVPSLAAYYRLLNCRYILTPFRLPPPFTLVRQNGAVGLYETEASPVLAAAAATTADGFDPFRFLEDLAAGRLRAIPLRTPGVAATYPDRPSVEVLAHEVRLDAVDLTLRVSSPCAVALAYAAYPTLRVFVDGRRVTPWESSWGTIVLPLEAGEVRIRLRPGRTPAATAVLLTAFFAFAVSAAAALLILLRRRRTVEEVRR